MTSANHEKPSVTEHSDVVKITPDKVKNAHVSSVPPPKPPPSQQKSSIAVHERTKTA